MREGDVERGVAVLPRVARIRFDEAVQHVVNDYRVNERRTVKKVEARIKRHLAPFFGGRRLAAIDENEIRAFVTARKEAGASNAEVNRELAILRRADRLAKLPARPDMPFLQEDNVRTGFFDRGQFDGVCQRLPEYLRPTVTFAYITGWRVTSEVLPLQWRQIDFSAEEVRLDPATTKNKKGRVFPFTAALRDLLHDQQAATDVLVRCGTICPFVFQRNGRPIRDFRKRWREACRAAGCPGRLLHDFRRTAVRNLERAGVQRTVAMQMVGHETESIYRRYDIVSHADLSDAARRLDASVGGNKPIDLSRHPLQRKHES